VEACLIISGVVLSLGVIGVLTYILWPRPVKGRPADPSPPPLRPRGPRGRFETCPSCDAALFPNDRDCPSCGLDLYGRVAGRLDRVRIARREIGYLREDGLLDPETAGRVADQLERRKQSLLHPQERPARPRVPPPLPAKTHRPESPRLPAEAPADVAQPVVPQDEPVPPPQRVAEPSEPATPRRSLADVLGQFMHERNILWGELAGGLLIVGCSIALVLSLWRTLQELPYFTFLLFAGITSAVFGAGQYTLHHWKLTATSRGLLVISLLLTPLNLLLLADPGAKGTTDFLDAMVKVIAVIGFGVLVRTGARDLVGIDLLPGRIPRRWLLALAVVGAPASQMIPPVFGLASLALTPVWLPVACFVAACGATINRLSREQRDRNDPFGEQPAVALLIFVGLSLFALFCAWGFFLVRADDLPSALRHLALPMVLAGVPVLSAGLLIQRRVIDPPGLRATGTAVSLSGMVILFGSLVLAWPEPTTLFLAAATVAGLLAWIAYRDELPWAYAGAIPCAGLAVVLAVQGITEGWTLPEGVDAGAWLAQGVTSASSGAVLVSFALVLAMASEFLARRSRMVDAIGYAIGASGIAVAGLLFVTVHGIEKPVTAAAAQVAAAIGFLSASFRWRSRVIAQVGVWLILVASLWSLWATIPGQPAKWGFVIAVEALLLAVVAVVLRRRGVVGALHQIQIACRDVAAGAAILAPLLALGAANHPDYPAHSGMLFAVAATAFVLAGLYRQRALTWIGSLTALVAIAHLMIFPFGWEPRYGALLLALLVHSTITLSAAFVLQRFVRLPGPVREPWSELYGEPLRLSARLTSCLALPLLLIPAQGMAGAWAGLAVWTGALWLAGAVAWRESGAFAAFQGAMTWAAGLAAFAWVERQAWFPASQFGPIDPRALQAYGTAIGLLSLIWVVSRRLLQSVDRVRTIWTEVRPSVDLVVLGALVIGQFLLAAGGVLPSVVQELTPAGTEPLFVPAAEGSHIWGWGAWLVLGILAITIGMVLRWPFDQIERADGTVLALTILALTVPFLIAGAYSGELATASALRWGLAVVFLVGSVIVALREFVGRAAERAGFSSSLSDWAPVWLRGLLAGAAGIVLVLTLQVAVLGLSGRAPTGPAADSIFRAMGWTASVIVPLAAVVVGLGVTAWRERSAGYAFSAGWVWTATLAGGYALGVVTAGGTLDAAEQMRVALLGAGAAAVWAILWLAAERRVPGNGLLRVQSAIGLAGLVVLAAIPLGLIMALPAHPLGPASARLGQEGWLVLVAAVAAAYWHTDRVAARWRFHVVGLSVALAGVLAACAVQPWDRPGEWLSVHVLAATWAAAAVGMTATVVRRQEIAPVGLTVWAQVFAIGLAIVGVRIGWDDPLRPFAPAGMVLVAGFVFGAVGYRAVSRPHEYLSGLMATLASVLVWVSWGPDSKSSLALACAIGLAGVGLVWAGITATQRLRNDSWDEPEEAPDEPGDDLLGLPYAASEMLPPFRRFAAAASFLLVLVGLVPMFARVAVDSFGLAWAAVTTVAVALGLLQWDRRATYSAAGLYVLGIAAIALGISEIFPGPVWLEWVTPIALAGYVLIASAVASVVFRRPEWLARLRLPDRAPGDVRNWFIVAQAITASAILGTAMQTAVTEPGLVKRLTGGIAALLLVPAAGLLMGASPRRTSLLRPTMLVLAAAGVGVIAWAIPDLAGPVPWLHRHGGLFVALVIAAVAFAEALPAGWAEVGRKVAGWIGVAALVVLAVFLVQQIPHFDPTARKTPLEPFTVGAVIVAILAFITLALRVALQPDRDPLGPTATGRQGYVYLAEVLLVLLFAHMRLNVPQLFRSEAVQYWTFIVMLLAFIGVGLAELFARRGLHVLSRPLLRTGVLLPLIPLVAFWAKPPSLLTEFAQEQAPGLQPAIGYLEKLPQHFDAYALLWFLAGLLYGLIALSRRSFAWALLGALATNAGLWALLSHHQVPAAVHPQAWAIPLALIVLVSEHVNRYRLREDVAASLRYLGISMIYVSSAADLFIAGIGQSLWLPVILAVLCLAGVVVGVLLRVRAFLYLGIGFLLLDVFSMIWYAAVDRQQTWVWYASGIVLGALILALFAILEKRRNDVQELVERLRQWNR